MPLPPVPTRAAHRTSARSPARQRALNDLLLKGIFCTLIGLGVLLSPRFITSPGMQGIVAQSSLVGWFALVLGLAFMALYAWRRRG